MKVLHRMFSAREGLGEKTGETSPCPVFTALQEICASHNLIMSFVSIIMKEHG